MTDMVCNKSDSELTSTVAPLDATIWLSDSDIRNVDTLISAGAGGAGIYYGLVEYGVITAAVSPAAAAIIGGVIAIEWALIKRLNDGCGVVLLINIDGLSATPNFFAYPQT